MKKPGVPKKAKRYFRNMVRVIHHATSLKKLLFEKINRHEVTPSKDKTKKSDFSDARHYEKFTRHSSHYSPRNYI